MKIRIVKTNYNGVVGYTGYVYDDSGDGRNYPIQVPTIINSLRECLGHVPSIVQPPTATILTIEFEEPPEKPS